MLVGFWGSKQNIKKLSFAVLTLHFGNTHCIASWQIGKTTWGLLIFAPGANFRLTRPWQWGRNYLIYSLSLSTCLAFIHLNELAQSKCQFKWHGGDSTHQDFTHTSGWIWRGAAQLASHLVLRLLWAWLRITLRFWQVQGIRRFNRGVVWIIVHTSTTVIVPHLSLSLCCSDDGAKLVVFSGCCMCGKEREAKGVGQWRKTLRRCIGKRDRIWGIMFSNGRRLI